MDIVLKVPDSLPLCNDKSAVEFRYFLQAVANRRCVGAYRYEGCDGPDRRKRYMTRLSKELRAYRKSGNVEHLFNIAVYAFLESAAPENRKAHWDAAVESVTRGEMGGNIA